MSSQPIRAVIQEKSQRGASRRSEGAEQRNTARRLGDPASNQSEKQARAPDRIRPRLCGRGLMYIVPVIQHRIPISY